MESQDQNEDIKIKEYKERFNRWHHKQIDLLTFLINFLFTISIAIAGFIIANQDKPLFKCKTVSDEYSLSRTALFILAVSVSIGMLALITRLEDFRRTKAIPKYHRDIYEARKKSKVSNKDIDAIKSKRDSIRSITKVLGQATWFLFYLQLILFMIALWMLVAAS